VRKLWVAPIVEGHGEYHCIRILIERICQELLRGNHVEVLRPFRHSRHSLVKKESLEKAVNFAWLKLRQCQTDEDRGMTLLLLDADTDLPCVLGPRLTAEAEQCLSIADIACVVVNIEYETWFIGDAESLRKYLDLSADPAVPESPEQDRLGKAWVEKRFRGTKYSETQDQPCMTASMDLTLCRKRCPSFDKLCRELANRVETL